MKYSAAMTHKVFAFVESKKMAELIVSGSTKEEIFEQVESENLFSLRDASRLKNTIGYVYERLNSLPFEALEIIASSDIEVGKLLLLIGIMKTDLLFGEFVYEVYRTKRILGEWTIENRDMNDFFDEKANQSEVVSKWSEATIKKLKTCYIKNLAEAGLVEDVKSKKVKGIILSSKVEKLLLDHDMEIYLKAVKGDR